MTDGPHIFTVLMTLTEPVVRQLSTL